MLFLLVYISLIKIHGIYLYFSGIAEYLQIEVCVWGGGGVIGPLASTLSAAKIYSIAYWLMFI